MLPALNEYSMATGHRHPISGEWNNRDRHLLDSREIYCQDYDPWSHNENANQWNQGPCRTADHEFYRDVPVMYQPNPQMPYFHAYQQDIRTSQNSSLQWHNISGPYNQRLPNVTVHHSGQMLHSVSGWSNHCSSQRNWTTQETCNAHLKSRSYKWRWHHFSNKPPKGHFRGPVRGQSRTRSRSRCVVDLSSSSCVTVKSNVSTLNRSSLKIHSVNTVPCDKTSGKLAPPSQEDQSDLLQLADMGCLRNNKPDVKIPNTEKDPVCQELSPRTSSVCTMSKQSGFSSQYFPTDTGTPGHSVSVSATAQPRCSMPVCAVTDSAPSDTLDPSPVDQDVSEKQMISITLMELKWLRRRIETIFSHGEYNLNQDFAVEIMDVLQPGKSTKGCRDEDSPLCVEIQSNSRCMVVKTGPLFPPQVAVVTPLEQQVSYEHTESGVKVHESEQLSVVDKERRQSESGVKRQLALKSVLENSDCSFKGRPFTASGLVPVEETIVSKDSTCVRQWNLGEVKERVMDISSVSFIQYTLSKLRKMIDEFESLITPKENKENVKDALLNLFWGGDIQNLLTFNKRELAKDMVDALPVLSEDENTVILQAVKGVELEEFLDRYPTFRHNENNTPEHKSSWLNVNESVDDIDHDPGVAWLQHFIPKGLEAETIFIKHQVETNTVAETERGETESEMQTDTPTGVETDPKAQTGRKTEILKEAETDMNIEMGVEMHVEKDSQTEAVTKVNGARKTKRIDLLPESLIASEKDHISHSICPIKITCLNTEVAKKVFDQLQENSTCNIDSSVLLSGINGRNTTSSLNEEQIMNHKDTLGLLSSQEEPESSGTGKEPAVLQSSCCSYLIETPDGFELALNTEGLTKSSSEFQDRELRIIPVAEYFLLDNSLISDLEDTEDVIQESKTQDLNREWIEPLSPSEITDSNDGMSLSDISVCIDHVEREEIGMKPHDQSESHTVPLNSHEVPTHPIRPCNLVLGVTNERAVGEPKPFSEIKGQQQKLGECCMPSSPFEEFESIDALINSKKHILSSDSGHVVSAPCHGKAESRKERRLKRPKVSWRRRLLSESESEMEGSLLMDNVICVPQKKVLSSLTVTDDSSVIPKRRRHPTKWNRDNINRKKWLRSSDSDSEDNPCNVKHVSQKRMHSISTGVEDASNDSITSHNTTHSQSETEPSECEDTRINIPQLGRYSFESNSNHQFEYCKPSIYSDVTEESSDGSTVSVIHSKKAKTSRLTFECRKLTPTEDSKNDSTVLQHHPVYKDLQHSCEGPHIFPGVQCLLVGDWSTSTAPLEHKRKSQEPKLHKGQTSREKKTNRSLIQKTEESPKMPKTNLKTKSTKLELYSLPILKHKPYSEQTKTNKSDKTKFSNFKSNSESPVQKNCKRRDERTYEQMSSYPYSSKQKKECMTKGKNGKKKKNSLQKIKHFPTAQSNYLKQKIQLHWDKQMQFVSLTKQSLDIPCSPAEEKERKKEEREDMSAKQKSSGHIFPMKKKERVDKREEHQDTKEDKKTTCEPHKDQHKTVQTQSRYYVPKVQGSSSQRSPRTAMVAAPTPKSPEEQMGSVKKQLHSNWESSFYITPFRKRRRSGFSEEDPCPRPSPEKNSLSLNQQAREEATVKKEQQRKLEMVRRQGPIPCDKGQKPRRNSQEHVTPLMKKSILQAKSWTNAIHHKTPKDTRCSRHGTHEADKLPCSTIEGCYKWAEKQNRRSRDGKKVI
ncbi:uncharacterized protein LOC134037550 [Osmerus eperlanus]|uniref:uncharacterized protein LOC134037550 n=1 Tax=Osmerus eperlanus TaxID=29151 RepID=UPI002E11FFD5